MADKKKKTIYISGHKNPDTDSICSAMALADLKNKIAEKQMMEEGRLSSGSCRTFESGNKVCDEGI